MEEEEEEIDVEEYVLENAAKYPLLSAALRSEKCCFCRQPVEEDPNEPHYRDFHRSQLQSQ